MDVHRTATAASALVLTAISTWLLSRPGVAPAVHTATAASGGHGSTGSVPVSVVSDGVGGVAGSVSVIGGDVVPVSVGGGPVRSSVHASAIRINGDVMGNSGDAPSCLRWAGSRSSPATDP